MTDNPPAGTAAELGVPASEPSVPVISFAEAQSRKSDFLASQEKMDALLKGDVNTTREWQTIVAGISAQPQTPTGPREDLVARLQESAGFTLGPRRVG